MKVKLQAMKGASCLCEGTYDVSDGESFGKACANLWMQVEGYRLRSTTSIGATYEIMSESVLDQLDGAQILVTRVR